MELIESDTREGGNTIPTPYLQGHEPTTCFRRAAKLVKWIPIFQRNSLPLISYPQLLNHFSLCSAVDSCGRGEGGGGVGDQIQ